MEITAHAAKAAGLVQFLPVVGGIDGAAKLFGIDKGYRSLRL